MKKIKEVESYIKLALSLLCKGIRIEKKDENFIKETFIFKRRAGLGSGINIVFSKKIKDIWINVPVNEYFVKKSPYILYLPSQNNLPDKVTHNNKWSYIDIIIENTENNQKWKGKLPLNPKWYEEKLPFSNNTYSSIGILQGTYLGIYVGNKCGFWKTNPKLCCKFCTTGLNVGKYEKEEKTVEEVIQTCIKAKKESNITFVHLNSGYREDESLKFIFPYVKAIKEKVGLLIGVQCLPPKDFKEYDKLIDLGVDHFSLCYEFHNKDYFQKYLPGKYKVITQERFFKALEYLTSKTLKGSVSGEIIAGIEPIEDTLKAIDYITDLGAFPTICIFRPLIGSQLERYESPKERDMEYIFKYMVQKCLEKKIPIGMIPNLEVSLILTPDDAFYLLPKNFKWYYHYYKMKFLKLLAYPYFYLKSSIFFYNLR